VLGVNTIYDVEDIVDGTLIVKTNNYGWGIAKKGCEIPPWILGLKGVMISSVIFKF
jgi:hypothetical protein